MKPRFTHAVILKPDGSASVVTTLDNSALSELTNYDAGELPEVIEAARRHNEEMIRRMFDADSPN